MRNFEVEMPEVGAFGFYDFMSVTEVLDTMVETVDSPLQTWCTFEGEETYLGGCGIGIGPHSRIILSPVPKYAGYAWIITKGPSAGVFRVAIMKTQDFDEVYAIDLPNDCKSELIAVLKGQWA